MWYDHEDRISGVQVSPDGTAVGSCSWDSTVRVRLLSNYEIIYEIISFFTRYGHSRSA